MPSYGKVSNGRITEMHSIPKHSSEVGSSRECQLFTFLLMLENAENVFPLQKREYLINCYLHTLCRSNYRSKVELYCYYFEVSCLLVTILWLL